MDRLLRASAGTALFAVLWLGVNLVHPVGPRALLWLPVAVAGPLTVLILLRTARTPELPEATRRFWRHLTVAVAFIAVGLPLQGYDVLTAADPHGSHTGPAMLAFCSTGLLIIMYALFRLPLGQQSRGEVARIVLDAGTVALAAAVFLWHYSTRAALQNDDKYAVYLSLIVTLVALLAVFAVVKFVLSSHLHVDNSALRLLAVAMVVGAVGPVFRPVTEAVDPTLFPGMATEPLVYLFGCWAAARQRYAVLATARRRGALRVRQRPFSLLPYVAVAAVDGLLISVTVAETTDETVVVAAAVLLTALVVVRQVLAFRDNSRLLARLDHGATHDALTHLPNRVLFHARLRTALTTPGDRPVAVALIDLDDFKEVNDTLGHEVGDQLLIGVAQRLQGCVRAQDTVARLGGDEFVVVLDDADPAAADLAAERMRKALHQPVYADGHELPIRASIGIADGRTGAEASVLLRQADIAMYAAKKLAGTAYLHYAPSMATAGSDHAHLGAELREAIDGGQLFLLYQPIVALDDGRILGAEALVRWSHPVRGVLAPDAFIPVAERTGLIVPLGRWVMRTAFAQLAGWIAEHGDAAPGALNVNVSARDLREPGFAEEVAALLAEYGLPADRIVLEITETMAVEPGQSVLTLHRLRGLGVRISLDDFGTGHSTLTLLHDCPIDEIKLDRSFTQAPVDDRVPVSAAVIHLAQALGLHAVAEGVETGEQAEQLLSLGYLAAQGYLFARPMPADRLGELLSAGVSLMPPVDVVPAA
ncbi:bifunctional diguanylate cyclase/phosphodiesterase [Actinoplanes sp. N902-109]|uniref:putative bifunctional diguanylate cyclase/phosphodiesterase n=1 Tax=Actinoplanes sp. (strain N902-109) TaxID=649831 RepID=UPI0003294498|nr:EAL domain-containing protein [Actinoplanes sp. N902-109]AGL14142.1 PAS/PAC sensor-containing diguanylate cyclase/phosphodiesterase [Actinoplanes sp. N902-109]